MAGLFSRLQKRSIGHHPYCTAVVVAAGSASRMKGIDKIMTTLGGIPVLARTLQALEQCGRIDEIVVVTRTDLPRVRHPKSYRCSFRRRHPCRIRPMRSLRSLRTGGVGRNP